MDRRHLYFLLFLLCTIQAAIGQQRSFSIKGVVKDASSGQPIAEPIYFIGIHQNICLQEIQ